MTTTFAAFANKHYRWLLCGNLAQFFAIAARMMICNLLAWQLTGTEVSLAFINLCLAVPMFVGALIAGPYVDRLERRSLIIIGLAIISVSEFSIVVAMLSDKLTFGHLLLITFVNGCVHPFVHPASIALTYDLLGREHIANGIALLSSGMNLSRIVGPAVTGGILALYSPLLAYSVVAALYVIALYCQWHLPFMPAKNSHIFKLFDEIKRGLFYLINDRKIALCLLFSLPPLMLMMSVQYLLVIFANEIWQVGDAGFGILLAAMGFGAFLGALIVAKFGGRVERFTFMVCGSLAAALFFALFSQSTEFSLSVVLLGFANMSAAIALVTNQIVIQLLAKDEVRGRVSGYIIMSYSLAPLALFPLTHLAKDIGVPNAVVIAAVGVFLIILLMAGFSTNLRHLFSKSQGIENKEK